MSPYGRQAWTGSSVGIHFKRVHFGIFSGAPPNIFLPRIWGLYFDLRSRQSRFLSLIQRSDYTKVLLYLNHICPRLLEHIQSERGGGGAGISAPPMYLGFGLRSQFLEITCLGMIYHFQKDSWSLDDQNPPRQWWTFHFSLVGEASDPVRRGPPYEILVWIRTLFFFGKTR